MRMASGSDEDTFKRDIARSLESIERASTRQSQEQTRASQAAQRAAEAERKASNSTSKREARGLGGSLMSGVSNVNSGLSYVNPHYKEDSDAGSFLWIVVAFIIWILIDRPFAFLTNLLGQFVSFGQPYNGFNFIASNVIRTDWIAIVVSGMFLAFLILNILFGLFERDVGLMVSIGILGVVSFLTKKALGEAITIQLAINWAILLLFAAAVLGFKYLPNLKAAMVGQVSYLIMAFTYSYLYINNDWMSSANTFLGVSKPMIHFLFITGFGLTYLRTKFPEDKLWCLLTALFLFADFFGPSLAKLFFLEGMPILFLFTIGAVASRTNNTTIQVITVAVAILLVGWIFGANQVQAKETAPYEEVAGNTQQAGESFFTKSLGNLFGAKGLFQKQIQYAVTGKVEQNQKEPLGVYLSELRTPQQYFYENENTIIWGSVRARTLDEPVGVKMGCMIKEGTKVKEADVDPKNQFLVFTQEDQDYVCKFPANTFAGSTSKNVIAYAEFNFETLAYVKRYFMDQERYRAMQREGQDPFTVFKIKDRNPIAVYTNGPVELGITTNAPLIGVSGGYIVKPSVTLSLKNKDGWQGKMTSLNELIILLPKGAVITNPATDCDRPLLQYDEAMCETETCGDATGRCLNACEGYPPEQRSNCEVRCHDEYDVRCVENCKYLFEDPESGSGSQYNGYMLDPSKFNTVPAADGSNVLEFVSCKFDAVPGQILDAGPITTKSIRVKARYDYRVEKQKTVQIKQDPSQIKVEISNPAIAAQIVRISRQQFNAPVDQPSDISTSMLFAMAAQSKFIHCKSGTACGTNNKENVNCDISGKCGVMMLQRKQEYGTMQGEMIDAFETTWRCPADTSSSIEETAYDLNCNIKTAIILLQQYKDLYGDNEETYNSEINKQCTNTIYQNKYKAYKDPWDRALRRYYGFACSSTEDIYYVDVVRKIMKDYDTGKYNNIQTLATQPAQTGAGSSASAVSGDFKPKNIVVNYLAYESLGGNPKFKVSWSLSLVEADRQRVSGFSLYLVEGTTRRPLGVDVIYSRDKENYEATIDIPNLNAGSYSLVVQARSISWVPGLQNLGEGQILLIYEPSKIAWA